MAFEMRQSRSCTNLWTTQQAAALISSWNHFRTVTTTPTFLDNADWHDYSLTPLPSWLSISRLTASKDALFYHSALLITFATHPFLPSATPKKRSSLSIYGDGTEDFSSTGSEAAECVIYTPVAVKPAKLIDSIVNMFEAELKTHQIAYKVNPDSSLVDLDIDHLCFDPSRVTQIFINLLTNAIKFVTPAKDPKISIRFGACLSDPRSLFPENMFWATERKSYSELTNGPEWGAGEEVYLTFSVKDSGIGLKDKEIHKIFERFRQANVKTHVKYGGSGLGLFISKELTEKQGGEIGVSSVFGQGSIFGFYVKTRRVQRQPQSMNEVINPGDAETASGPLHVLLVEDNLINQKVLGKQLKKAGLQVEVANHGLEALDTLAKQSFDVVLMDLEMPVLDGLGAMRQIRNRELTGEGLANTKEASKKSGERLPSL
jgi:hypothetical protein